MTIPDIGHCAGSGANPIEETADGGEPGTGVCPACSGRFGLRQDGKLSLHETAPVDAREELDLGED